MKKEKEIKFSRSDYCKLSGIEIEKPIILMEVFSVISRTSLSSIFISYDTAYRIKDHVDLCGNDANFFQLPKGELFVLLFVDSGNRVFTTIRSRYGKLGDKMPYYIKARGEQFKIKLEEAM